MNNLNPKDGVYSPGRLKRLVFHLLYPAVLGTFFVSLLPAAADSVRNGVNLKFVISLLVVAHFVIDYLYTEEVRDYRVLTFLLDLAVIVLLYVAYSAVQLGHDNPIGVRAASLAMAGVYGCFLLWEYLAGHEIGWHLGLTVYEALAAVWFLLAGLLWPTAELVLAIGLGAATTLMVIVGGSVLRAYHGGVPWADAKPPK